MFKQLGKTSSDLSLLFRIEICSQITRFFSRTKSFVLDVLIILGFKSLVLILQTSVVFFNGFKTQFVSSGISYR